MPAASRSDRYRSASAIKTLRSSTETSIVTGSSDASELKAHPLTVPSATDSRKPVIANGVPQPNQTSAIMPAVPPKTAGKRQALALAAKISTKSSIPKTRSTTAETGVRAAQPPRESSPCRGAGVIASEAVVGAHEDAFPMREPNAQRVKNCWPDPMRSRQ